MKLGNVIRRFFVPGIVNTAICLLKYKALVSFRAEVEVTGDLRLGKGAQISSYCKIKATGGVLEIGSDTDVGSGVFMSTSAQGLRIGSKCLIGPNCSIVANNYDYSKVDVPLADSPQTSKGIVIEDNVWLGAGVVVLDGCQIGSGAIITPNSVVSGRIPANAIVTGNPGQIIFTRR